MARSKVETVSPCQQTLSWPTAPRRSHLLIPNGREIGRDGAEMDAYQHHDAIGTGPAQRMAQRGRDTDDVVDKIESTHQHAVVAPSLIETGACNLGHFRIVIAYENKVWIYAPNNTANSACQGNWASTRYGPLAPIVYSTCISK